MTYDAMMQLSLPRNPLRQEMFRSFLIWFTTSCILFATNQLTTLPVGFFPSYAQEHLGMTSLDLSFFFSVYPLCIMISSPLAASTVICLGLMLSGSTTIAFAYSSTSGSVFVLRILQGIGAGAAVLVIQEFVVAAAFISAPPLGSALYEYGGFEMPFLAAGVAQLLLVMIVPFLFIEYALPDGLYSRGPIPSAIFPAPTVDNGVTFKDVLTPTCLLGAQHVAIGFGFALSAFVYFLGGILYVWLSRKCGCKHVIICGLLQLAVGFFFLGPPPFLNSYFNDYVRLWSTQWLSLVCIGCGAALSIAPGLPLTLMSVSTQGTHAFNLVIGLFSSAIYCGQALGPFLALLLMHVLPSTPTSSCFAESAPSSPSLDSNVINACDSSLPWAFTVYSFVLLALLVFVIFNLSTGDDIIAFLKKRKRVSLSRQTSEYGQFIFLDDNEDEVS
ncbi:TPA: hypothetical protein N0F65_008524 [Lagenidium giganteum]|uniref:Uncharacterized protein n=1 Tax=Lagenidium giganteum TaxID=4803 RepID=A0AAV2Z0N2_9STRA|nr:TPA: hypothetical protein N0F65_008524 [Lagenidium giganteum]